MATRTIVQNLSIAGTQILDTALTQAGGAKSTDAVDMRNSDGYMALLVSIVASGSPSLDITVTVSDDGTTFYTPKDIDNTSLTATVCTALTATRWIVIGHQLAPYVKFTITPNANTTATLKLITRESR